MVLHRQHKMKLSELEKIITPIPHTIGMNLLPDGKHLAIWDESGKRVVAMFAPPENHTEEDDSNALYYLHAANLLPSLVATLKDALEKIEATLDDYAAIEPLHVPLKYHDLKDAQKSLTEAIERAEEVKMENDKPTGGGD